MSPLTSYVLALFITLYAIVILVEAIATRRVKPALIQLVILAAVVAVLNATTGFPRPRVAFGGASPVTAIGIMFLCTVLGVAAHYAFYLEGTFSWRSLLKPLVISPIVLLPLIGSVQGAGRVETIQLISFAILAFQNGFFWKVVLEHAKAQL